ncbi:MAG: hypothetical protein ACO3U3_11575 [Alphaproteobacteria bacterium]
MTIQKNAYVVMDTETSFRNGLVFDFGWTTIDKRGNVLGTGDLNFLDVITKEKPYYINKIAGYAKRQRHGVHKVTTFAAGRRLFNAHLSWLERQGYRIILCAYNAGFDCRVLGSTSKAMGCGKFLMHSVDLLDIWGNWANSAPKTYDAPLTASGKFLSTTAQNVYRFEMQMPDFIEAHTAADDTRIEAQILMKILRRKKRLHIVQNPRDFQSRIWELFEVKEVAHV